MAESVFQEQFPKSHRPEITELEGFWAQDVAALFRSFAAYILDAYDLRFGMPVWSERNGWTYRIGKSGVYFINGIRIEEAGFVVDGLRVTDEASYARLLAWVKALYEKNETAFRAKIAEKNAQQAQRSKARAERERALKLERQEGLVPERYNVFHWPAKLNIQKLKRLYQLDAQGIQDEVLADEVGLTLFLRCKYGKEDMARMEQGGIRCHHCGAELYGDSDFRQCACGGQYSYQEYRRSYRRNNMPTGAAARVFDAFMEGWSGATCYQQKIILIDTLLHAFHLSLVSGAVHRPVAMNFIDGTRERVTAIIQALAQDA